MAGDSAARIVRPLTQARVNTARVLLRPPSITAWEPEDAGFWAAHGRKIASRNLWTSAFVEHIGFCIWSLWSVLVLFMTPKTGFTLSAGDKFLLASIVTLIGSAVRPLYGYAVTRLGGRTWTVISALLLFVPVIGATILMGYPKAPFAAFVVCAAVSGIGGGSFASSTTNINFFFPEREKGRALGINAGAGNLGVATVQLLGLLVIATAGIRSPRILSLIFVPLLLVAVAAAYGRMDNLPDLRTGGTVYGAALKDPYTWVISVLYIGTPRVTLVSFAGLAVGTALTAAVSALHHLSLFVVAFVVLFALSGLGNGSTYAMIPVPYKAEAERAIATGEDPASARLTARRRAGAVIAIAGTFGGLGGVAINLAFRQSYATAHNARPALIGFLIFYAVCVAVTRYARRRASEIAVEVAA